MTRAGQVSLDVLGYVDGVATQQKHCRRGELLSRAFNHGPWQWVASPDVCELNSATSSSAGFQTRGSGVRGR